MTELERLRAENAKLKRLVARMGTACANALNEIGKAEQPELISASSEDVSKVVKLLWDATPKMGRARSSRAKLEKQWRAVPRKERPDSGALLLALVGWTKTEKWTKDGGQFVEGIDQWVKNRQWVDVPEPAKAVSKPSHKIRPV